MSFIMPLALAFLGLLPVIVLLYFLKLKRREQTISSTYLWQQAIQDLRVNSPFQRLRKNLLLWLQLLLLAALVLGLARPALNMGETLGKRYIVLVDTSASMAARDGDPDRMALATKEALRLVGDMTRDDRMMVIAFDVQPRVLVPFTGVKSKLREGIALLAPRQTSTDFQKAVELVTAFAQEMPNAHLYLISDGAFDPGRLGNAPPIEFSYIKVGARAHNVGITAMDARRSVEEWERPQVFVRVENFGEDEAEVRMDLYLNDTLFDARALVIGPGGSGAAVFSDPNLKEGLVKAVLNREDDLAADNTAWLVLTEPKQVRTLLVTEGNYFLQLAAQKDPLCSPILMTPAEYAADARSGASVMTDYDLVIFDRHVPESLPAGAYVFLAALPPLKEFYSEGEAKDPLVIDWDTVHPVNQYLSYANIFIQESMKMKAPENAVTLVEGDVGPLVLWWASPKHRILVVGFDMFRSRWPLRVSFPIFFANALRYLGGVQFAASARMVRPGKVISFAVSPDTAEVQVTVPGGRTANVSAENGRITYSDTFACGPYSFQVREDKAETYVANLLDSRESNTAPSPTVRWHKSEVVGTTRALKENREIWPWFLLGALAVLMIEWYIYNRRVYV